MLHPQRSMIDLIVELHLEPSFSAHLAVVHVKRRRIPLGEPERSNTTMVGAAPLLAALLDHLGLPANTPATQCFALVDGATARAANSIADWMSYLPESCVRAMVGDGWHWST